MKTWLLSGSPAHWLQLLALLGYSLLEWVLPRVKIVAANSTVELVANALKPLLARVPLVGAVLAKLGTPVPDNVVKLFPTDSSPRLLLPFALLLGLASSCAHVQQPTPKQFGGAFASCMEAKGKAAALPVALEAWGDLNNGATEAAILQQLEALAGQAGEDAVTCAVEAWMQAPRASRTGRNPAGMGAAKAWLRRVSAVASLVPPSVPPCDEIDPEAAGMCRAVTQDEVADLRLQIVRDMVYGHERANVVLYESGMLAIEDEPPPAPVQHPVVHAP